MSKLIIGIFLEIVHDHRSRAALQRPKLTHQRRYAIGIK